MEITDIDFRGFETRDRLKQIGRFHMYDTMFYRPDVFFHSRKVFHLIKAALPYLIEKLGNTFDADRVLVMALVHDDAEMITWDVQAGKRAKMSQEQLKNIHASEESAIDSLAVQYPHMIWWYNYHELLLEVAQMQTLESQIVKYLDHFDAFGEVMHELFAGNWAFIIPFVDPQLGEVEVPHAYYLKRFNDYVHKYPLLAWIMSDYPPFLAHYLLENVEEIVAHGKLHNLESLKLKTGVVRYDRRKQVLLESLEEKEMKHLILPKERATGF